MIKPRDNSQITQYVNIMYVFPPFYKIILSNLQYTGSQLSFHKTLCTQHHQI